MSDMKSLIESINITNGGSGYQLYWVLDKDGEPRPSSFDEYARQNTASPAIRVDVFRTEDYKVSTVFLGIDHDYTGLGVPILWETMVFGGRMDGYQERCGGKQKDAKAMHDRVVELVKTEEAIWMCP